MPFDEIVSLVARQTHTCKAAGPLIMAARSFEFLSREWDAVPLVRRPGHLPFWLPLLAGVSNVNLSRIVGGCLIGKSGGRFNAQISGSGGGRIAEASSRYEPVLGDARIRITC
jgi:hypothetical protein